MDEVEPETHSVLFGCDKRFALVILDDGGPARPSIGNGEIDMSQAAGEGDIDGGGEDTGQKYKMKTTLVLRCLIW